MQCPHYAHPDSIRHCTSRGVQRYRSKAFRRIFNTTTRQRASPQATGLSALTRGNGDASDRQGSRHSSQDVSRCLVKAVQSRPASPSHSEVCSSTKIDELCIFIAKKNLNASCGQRQTPSLVRFSALPVEEGRSKRVRSFGSRSSTCRRWAMAQTC